MRASGGAAAVCLQDYAKTIQHCRNRQDDACEATARVGGGVLEAEVAGIETSLGDRCPEEAALTLGYTSAYDVIVRTQEACVDFAEDWLDNAYADDPSSLTGNEIGCQRRVARRLEALRDEVVRQLGRQCYVKGATGQPCDLASRERALKTLLRRQRDEILDLCGPDFDALSLSTLDPGSSTLRKRVKEVLKRTRDRARHFAQLVYPPNDLGPAADFGPHPVGVTTLALADASRSNVDDTGPRPVKTEVYYPSTEASVAGHPKDVAKVIGIDIVETPTYRDVDVAAGPFPMVVFSHGNDGIRFQSIFFATHLASHGFIVVSPDHYGNNFVDTGNGIVDPDPATNRPLDMSFVIDTMLEKSATPDDPFEGAVDADRIGASGHSFGGYTTFALVGGEFGGETFTDPRIRAAFPQAPASGSFPEDFFATIGVPILIVGGSIDETTPFESQQQRAFDHLPSGASVVGLARLEGAGHFTFSDFCEVPRILLSFLGGFDEACEPRHLPWRHAHDIINYLSLSFFDGVLNDDAEALARLDPSVLAAIPDLDYQEK